MTLPAAQGAGRRSTATGKGDRAGRRDQAVRSIAQSCRAPPLIIETLTEGGSFIVIARVPPMTEAALSFGAGKCLSASCEKRSWDP